jgi:hypothetical protein
VVDLLLERLSLVSGHLDLVLSLDERPVDALQQPLLNYLLIRLQRSHKELHM